VALLDQVREKNRDEQNRENERPNPTTQRWRRLGATDSAMALDSFCLTKRLVGLLGGDSRGDAERLR